VDHPGHVREDEPPFLARTADAKGAGAGSAVGIPAIEHALNDDCAGLDCEDYTVAADAQAPARWIITLQPAHINVELALGESGDRAVDRCALQRVKRIDVALSPAGHLYAALGAYEGNPRRRLLQTRSGIWALRQVERDALAVGGWAFIELPKRGALVVVGFNDLGKQRNHEGGVARSRRSHKLIGQYDRTAEWAIAAKQRFCFARLAIIGTEPDEAIVNGHVVCLSPAPRCRPVRAWPTH
jgi:hypothetical protein